MKAGERKRFVHNDTVGKISFRRLVGYLKLPESMAVFVEICTLCQSGSVKTWGDTAPFLEYCEFLRYNILLFVDKYRENQNQVRKIHKFSPQDAAF